MIGSDMYAFSDKRRQKAVTVSKYANIIQVEGGNNRVIKTVLAQSDHNRTSFAIANYTNRAVFVSGGNIGEEFTNTVLKFDLSNNIFKAV